MLRLSEIQSALYGLVGWEQSYDLAKEIAADLTTSESGLTFQGAHPLVTLDNIRSIIPDDWGVQYPAWDTDTPYPKGAKVSHASKVWIATATAIAGDEPGIASEWEQYNMLSDYLRRLTLNGINTTIQTFATQKQLAKESRSLLERRPFFDGAARLTSIITPTSKIVGMELVPVRAMGVTTKLERIGLQMVGATGIVRVYIFHSSQVEPQYVLELDFTNTHGGFQWFDLKDVYLPYISADTDAGGAWFLCYDENELPSGMRALNVAKDWSKSPCETCLGYGVELWREMTKYLQVSPFCINEPEGFHDSPAMFDIGEISYTRTMNYGINAEISVGCDLTDFIIRERAMFAQVIQKQVAVNVLRTLALNPSVRVNRNQANANRDDLLYEIDGNTTGRPGGLGHELAQAYKALSLDTAGLDRICLQCNNHGVKYRTV